MPNDSTSPISIRHSGTPVALPQEPIGPASGPAATSLGQPSAARPGPSRARSPEGPASARDPAKRNVSSMPAGPLRSAGSADRATKALHREIDRTLSALAVAKSPRAVASALKSLAKAQEKAAARGGTATQAQVRIDQGIARIEHGIAKLGAGDLGKLLHTLQGKVVGEAQALLGEDGAAVRLLSTIEHFVVAKGQEDAARTLHAEVGAALLASLRSSGTFDLHAAAREISNTFRLAEQSLARLSPQGLGRLSLRELHDHAEAAVLNALAGLSHGDQGTLMACMSSADLHRLAATAARLRPHVLEARVTQAISQRTDHLHSMMLEACEAFLSQDASATHVLPHDGHPPRIDTVLQRLPELEAHCALAGIPVPESVTHQLDRVRAHVAAALSTASGALLAARPAELRHVGEVARRLDMGEGSLRPLRAAATTWHGYLAKECSGLLRQTLTALRDGDPADALHRLAQLEAVTHELVDASLAMGDADARDRGAIANDMFPRILQAMEPELLAAAEKQLQGAFGCDLLATLYQASTDDRSPPEALARLMLVTNQLEQLPERIATTLRGDQPAKPGNPMLGRAEIPRREPQAGPLPLQMRQAVEHVLGVAAPEHGDDTRRGMVNEFFKRRFETVLAEPATVRETTPVRLPSGLEVSRGFFGDAQRRFDFRLPDGSPLIDYEKDLENWNMLSPDEITQRIDAGANRLLELYGGDAQTVLVATSRAFQSSTAPLQAGAAAVSLPGEPGDGNPARLADGTHGYAFNKHWSSAESTSITFLAGATGRPQLLVDLRHRGGALEPSNGGPRVYLDPQASSMRLRAHVEFPGPIGELRALGVPTYEAHLVPHAFQKPYPPPTMRTLFAKDSFDEDAARRELEAHAATRGRGGVVPTVMAIDAFSAAPTLEAAEAVLAANRPQAERGGKIQAARGVVERVTREQGAALVACFDRAMQEQVGLIRHRYLADMEDLRKRPDWPQGLEPPRTYDELLANGPPEAIKAYDALLRHPLACPEFVEFREGLEALRRSPDVAGARALYERWVKPERGDALNFDAPSPQQLRLNLQDASTRHVRDAIDRVASAPLDPDLFDAARGELGTIVDSDLAPAFIADVTAGRA